MGTNIVRAMYILAKHKLFHFKYDVEQFAYDLKVLGKLICMSEEQV